MKFEQIINERVAGDPIKFAQSFNKPQYASWIAKQYNNGYTSRNDYLIIIRWADKNKSNLSNYSFVQALNNAKDDGKSLAPKVSDDAEYVSKDIEIKFEDGKYWLHLTDSKSDLAAACRELQYDLRSYEKQDKWVLINSQDKTVVCLIRNDNSYKLIGHADGEVRPYSHEIQRLCVKLGLAPIADSMSDDDLYIALKTRQIDPDALVDLRKTLNRLTAEQIIDCKLIDRAMFLPFGKIISIYKRTKQFCLLKFVAASCIYHGLTNTKLYNICQQEILANHPEFADDLKSSEDDRHILSIIDSASKEISLL